MAAIAEPDLAGRGNLRSLIGDTADDALRPDQAPEIAIRVQLFHLMLGMAALSVPVKIPPRHAVEDHDDAGAGMQQLCNAGYGCGKLMPLEPGDDEILWR